MIAAMLITYTLNIQPLFKEKCSMCHNEQMMPEKNWMSYDIAYKYRMQIKYRVYNLKNMPMTGSMTDDERKLVKDWVDTGGTK